MAPVCHRSPTWFEGETQVLRLIDRGKCKEVGLATPLAPSLWWTSLRPGGSGFAGDASSPEIQYGVDVPLV